MSSITFLDFLIRIAARSPAPIGPNTEWRTRALAMGHPPLGDAPEADRLTLHLLAAVAEYE
jgi:hypothetical protein